MRDNAIYPLVIAKINKWLHNFNALHIVYIQCICKHHKVYNNFTNPLVYIIQTCIKNRHIMYYTGIESSTLESRASLVSHPCSVPSDRIMISFNKLTVSVKSVVEATQYLLSHGVDYVLTQAFCQDPLEEHFSRHRAIGRRSDNPTLWGFGLV